MEDVHITDVRFVYGKWLGKKQRSLKWSKLTELQRKYPTMFKFLCIKQMRKGGQIPKSDISNRKILIIAKMVMLPTCTSGLVVSWQTYHFYCCEMTCVEENGILRSWESLRLLLGFWWVTTYISEWDGRVDRVTHDKLLRWQKSFALWGFLAK